MVSLPIVLVKVEVTVGGVCVVVDKIVAVLRRVVVVGTISVSVLVEVIVVLAMVLVVVLVIIR